MTPGRLDAAAPRAPARRTAFLLCIGVLVAGGTWLFWRILAADGITALEAATLLVFTICFALLAHSFTAAMVGFALLVTGRDPIFLRPPEPRAATVALRSRVAILVPVYNEDVERVAARVVAMCASVVESGHGKDFDLYLLSDTRDEAIALAERRAMSTIRARFEPGAGIYYRRRDDNAGKKAGNIAEWVRRHGGAYGTMIVLDADSALDGRTMVTMAQLIEDNPRTGIIQTLPVPCGRRTFFGRALQFAAALYGPIFATGHSFWQMGESNYFGHNAAIRVSAFAASCGLPTLSGTPPLGGDILSHDFVEAACIRRQGWLVWTLPTLGDSFEEVPANILDYAARDRRWAQGNLQHARLVPAEGLHWMSRLHMLLGILAYVASPLWLCLLVLGTALTVDEALSMHQYFPPEPMLFPLWPQHREAEIGALISMTLVLLFGPRLLPALYVLASRARRRRFGGGLILCASVVAELTFSALFAPIMMLFHSVFVVNILLGRSVGWNAQDRGDRGVPWRVALRRHAPHVGVGIVWLAIVVTLAPDFAPWIAPVVTGLLLAPVITSWSSRRSDMPPGPTALFSTWVDTRRPRILDLVGTDTTPSPEASESGQTSAPRTGSAIR